GMESTISNAPPLTPQNKGTVECGFKLLHQSIAALTPGYEPARNLMRRRGKHYDRDASLTLDEFIAIVLAAIIKHNRTPMGKYRM
ncbi:transcriptional antiterminator, partial [Burkholderia sp. SIMBA_051]